MSAHEVRDCGDGYTAMQLLDADASMKAVAAWAHHGDAQVLDSPDTDPPYLYIRNAGARIWFHVLIGEWLVLPPSGKFYRATQATFDALLSEPEEA